MLLPGYFEEWIRSMMHCIQWRQLSMRLLFVALLSVMVLVIVKSTPLDYFALPPLSKVVHNNPESVWMGSIGSQVSHNPDNESHTELVGNRVFNSGNETSMHLSSLNFVEERNGITVSEQKLVVAAETTLSPSALPQNLKSHGYENKFSSNDAASCYGVKRHVGYPNACFFVRAQPDCRSQIFFKYLKFFYCTCEKAPLVGYAGLVSLLLTLFYMLGSTATQYFSFTVQKLSDVLNLSPAMAGITLLAFANGAPDVFSCIQAFITSGTGTLGLNSVLGGCIFVTTVVSGSICFVTTRSFSDMSFQLDFPSFLRDVAFLLISWCVLASLIYRKSIDCLKASAFLSIYAVYVAVVAIMEILRRNKKRSSFGSVSEPLLGDPSATTFSQLPRIFPVNLEASEDECYEHKGKHFMCARIYYDLPKRSVQLLCRYSIELPLTLVRRLTIPIIEENRWSRPLGVTSVSLAPLFLALLWHFKTSDSAKMTRWPIIALAGMLALVLGILAYLNTESNRPPRRFLFSWLAAGFLMSIVWLSFIAQELIAVLACLGLVMNINQAILGITILAWGNSVGDLVTNVVLASNGRTGIQVAISGCYAGAIFNTLVGLGLSLVLGSWKSHLVIAYEQSFTWSMGFLCSGLAWGLIVLLLHRMYLNRRVGVGLLIIYTAFLIMRIRPLILALPPQD